MHQSNHSKKEKNEEKLNNSNFCLFGEEEPKERYNGINDFPNDKNNINNNNKNNYNNNNNNNINNNELLNSFELFNQFSNRSNNNNNNNNNIIIYMDNGLCNKDNNIDNINPYSNNNNNNYNNYNNYNNFNNINRNNNFNNINSNNFNNQNLINKNNNDDFNIINNNKNLINFNNDISNNQINNKTCIIKNNKKNIDNNNNLQNNIIIYNIDNNNNKNIYKNFNNNNNNFQNINSIEEDKKPIKINQSKILNNNMNKDKFEDKNNIKEQMKKCNPKTTVHKRKIKRKETEEERIKREKEEKEESEIRDKLKCYICFGKVNKARMCLNCKKIACDKCVRNIIEKFGKCQNCKKESTLNDIIPLSFMDDLTSYFIHNVENKNIKIKNNNDIINEISERDNKDEDEDMKDEFKNNVNNGKNKSFNINNINNEVINNISNSNNSNSNINIENNEDDNIPFCTQHRDRKVEYYCLQCNEYLCSKCLLFFNQTIVDKHKNHKIPSIQQLENFNIKNAINEYKKLIDTNNNLDNVINNCNSKIRELEIKKSRINDVLDSIKKEISTKFIDQINNIKDIIKSAKNKKEKIENSIDSIPNSFNNIINENDYGQGGQILEELKKLNKEVISNEQLEQKSKIKSNLFFESFESEKINLILPNNGNYQEELKIIDKELNFIPEHKCKLSIQLLGGNIHFSITLKVDNEYYLNHNPKFYGHFILINSKKRTEYSIFGGNYYANGNQILSVDFDFNEIKGLLDDNISCNLIFYITKSYYK